MTTYTYSMSGWGPGKFFSEADEAAYELTLDGCQGGEFGAVDELGGWNGLVLLDPAEFSGFSAAIVTEDEQGFVSVSYFTTEEEATREFDLMFISVAAAKANA